MINKPIYNIINVLIISDIIYINDYNDIFIVMLDNRHADISRI